MDKPLVTIIIPFYNEERLLQRAIESAINQTYPKIQILLINDGSTDNSKEIAKSFDSKYKNIELVNTINQGLGAARNRGVNLAKGAFITFLDADDALCMEMVDKMVNALLDTQSDLAICGFNLYDIEGEKLNPNSYNGTIQVLDSVETIRCIHNNKISSTAWGKLYKKSIIKNILAPEKIWFEDDSFVLETLLNSRKVCLMNEPMLEIYSRKESIVRRLVTIKRIKDFNTSFSLQLDLLTKFEDQLGNHFPHVVKSLFKYYYSRKLNDLILIFSDLPRLDKVSKSKIKEKYLFVIEDTMIKQQQNNVMFALKFKVLIALLISPKYIGWLIPKGLIYCFKSDRFKRLKRLRGI